MAKTTRSVRWNPTTELGLPDPLCAVIDGEWVDSGDTSLPVEDPAAGVTMAELREPSPDVVDRAVESAQRCFDSTWAPMSGPERGRVLTRIGHALLAEADELATAESVDTGKPLRQARSDVEVSARYFEYYGGMADKILGETIPQQGDVFAYTTREPFGVVGHITPWNSPLSQLGRGVAPCLAAGNTVVVKPSEIAPISSLLAARLFVRAGLPAGACNVVPGLGGSAGVAIVGHPLVRHLTFTGSVATGTTVLHHAAEKVMPCTLELGGKSPTIVLPDAGLAAAAHAGALAVVRNSGQSCFATTRLLVHRSIHQEFTERLVAEVSGLRAGHGLDDPDLGPLASAKQLERVENLLASARDDGATVAVGGARLSTEEGGYFYRPTVLLDVDMSMRVAREEIFGPVQSVLVFDDEDEALRIANDTSYGLAAGVFTRDLGAAHRLASRLAAGQVHVNRYPLGGVDTPFGGYKKSGIGREKGHEAIRHYTQVKSVLMALD